MESNKKPVNNYKYLFLLIFLLSFKIYAEDKNTNLVSESPFNAKAYIVSPQNGAIVDTKFKVIFGLGNMGIAPAGVESPNTGHHHLLIDQEELPDLSQAIPANDKIIHFGKGQTETELTLAPGKHTLQLLLGNHFHIPHNPPVLSEKITIIVK